MSHSPLSPFYFAVGWVFGYANSAVLLVSLAAILVRRRRRVLSASVAVLSWIVLITGAACAIAYLAEAASSLLLRGNPYERQMFVQQVFGIFCLPFWLSMIGSVIAPQLFWFRRYRTNPFIALGIAVAIMSPWAYESLVRYITQQAEYLPDSWKH